MSDGYYLDEDSDGHWYVVPVAVAKEWDAWLEACDRHYYFGSGPNPGPMPEGIVRVGGGPQRVTFPSYEIDRT